MKKLYFYFIAAGLVCLAAACNKEADVQAPAPEAQTQKVIIHAGMEGSGTKVSIDGSTGKFSWNEGDKIAVHTSGADWVESDELGADPGASADFTLSLTDAERDWFAVYPSSSAGTVSASALTISYPDTYYLKSLDSEDARLVMVAKNAPGKDLEFKHVPKGAHSLYVNFLDKIVHGNFDVTGLDSEPFAPTVTATSGSCRVIFYFPSSLAAMQDVVLNIPVPTGDLGRIKVQAADAGGYDFTNPLTITGPTLARAHGKKMEMYLPTFSVSATKKVIFSPGNLQASTTDYGTNWTWGFAKQQYELLASNATVNGKMAIAEESGSRDIFRWSNAKSADFGINAEEVSTYYDYVNNTFLDWGTNVIDGYPAGTWRTPGANLTYTFSSLPANIEALSGRGEIEYLFEERSASTITGLTAVGGDDIVVDNSRYVKAYVCGVRAYVLFPDHFIYPEGVDKAPLINRGDSWWRATYDATTWPKMEAAGAICLPCVNGSVFYYTSTYNVGDVDGWGVNMMDLHYNYGRIGWGRPYQNYHVRLVRDAN